VLGQTLHPAVAVQYCRVGPDSSRPREVWPPKHELRLWSWFYTCLMGGLCASHGEWCHGVQSLVKLLHYSTGWTSLLDCTWHCCIGGTSWSVWTASDGQLDTASLAPSSCPQAGLLMVCGCLAGACRRSGPFWRWVLAATSGRRGLWRAGCATCSCTRPGPAHATEGHHPQVVSQEGRGRPGR